MKTMTAEELEAYEWAFEQKREGKLRSAGARYAYALARYLQRPPKDAEGDEGTIADQYGLTITIEADDFESMLNTLHVVFQDVAAGTINGSKIGVTTESVLTITGPMDNYKHEYINYRDAADEEA